MTIPSHFPDQRVSWLLLFLLLVCCAAVYWPGLSGSYLLDDQANLRQLEKLSAPLTWEQLSAYTISGNAGPLGRPLSLLSFAFQYDAWPADPAAFKKVNLLLHLTNGILIFWLTLLLSRGLPGKQSALPALLLAAVWLLHPLQVSTSLYIIQRMTLLASMFTLLGLIGIFQGRLLISAGKHRIGYLLATGGLLLGGLLATLSKESGVLLPAFALAAELTLFRGQPLGKSWQRWTIICLGLPIALGLVYFTLKFQLLANYEGRAFTLEERLLTESRVIIDYLRKIMLLPPYHFGVFFDDFAISRNLWSPPSTAPAIVLLTLLLAGAYLARRKATWLTFAITWFFTGHLLESTVVPLEIYFEHRNYLPVYGVLFGLVHGAQQLAPAMPKSRRLYPLLAMILILAATSLTWQQTRLWGNSLAQAVVWAKEKPLSQRALERAGVMLALEGYQEHALAYFDRISQQFPKSPNGPLLRLYHQCLYELPDPVTVRDTAARLTKSEKSTLAVSTLSEIVRIKEQRRCSSLAHASLQQYFDALLLNPHYAGQSSSLMVLRGRAYWAAGERQLAVAALDAAFKMKRNKEIAFQQLLWATQMNDPALIALYLTQARTSSTGNRQHDRLIDQQLQALQKISVAPQAP